MMATVAFNELTWQNVYKAVMQKQSVTLWQMIHAFQNLEIYGKFEENV